MKYKKVLLMLSIATLSLSGCKKSEPIEQPVTTEIVETTTAAETTAAETTVAETTAAETTAEEMTTARNRENTRMDVKAGKIIRLEISIVPIIRMPTTKP